MALTFHIRGYLFYPNGTGVERERERVQANCPQNSLLDQTNKLGDYKTNVNRNGKHQSSTQHAPPHTHIHTHTRTHTHTHTYIYSRTYTQHTHIYTDR